MFWILFLTPLVGFAGQVWTPFGSEVEINSPRYEQVSKEISFKTTCPVQVECSYPVFFGKDMLIEHVNQDLKIEAEDRFDKFVKEERSSDEVWEEECFLSYDLFIKGSGYRLFLLQYCENYFKSSGYGYYSSLPEFSPELELHDLDIFVLTDKGLMVVFRAYRVGGWADGPDTVLISYTELK